jgi:hypothetical protein
MGVEIDYTLSNWQALLRYIEDGDLQIDNNSAKYEANGAKQIVGPFAIARHPDGTILRNIDLNKWEKITDEEGLKGYQKCFDDRDKAAEEKASAAYAG